MGEAKDGSQDGRRLMGPAKRSAIETAEDSIRGSRLLRRQGVAGGGSGRGCAAASAATWRVSKIPQVLCSLCTLVPLLRVRMTVIDSLIHTVIESASR